MNIEIKQAKIKWWVRLCLWFVKPVYAVDPASMEFSKWKKFRGKYYIVSGF